VYSGGYFDELLGDSSKFRGFKIVSGIIHNFHTDKLVTENNHLMMEDKNRLGGEYK
jgi:hypothetical protein